MMYRFKTRLEIFLVHPGGPFFIKRDEGAWSIPKGLADDNEDLFEAARREFREETGLESNGPFINLDMVKQKGGKSVYAWAFEGTIPRNYEPVSNVFELEWPPHSGNVKHYPEIDRADFFSVETAELKINPAQRLFIKRLREKIKL